MNDIKQIVESAVLENGIYVARTNNGIYKFPPEMREISEIMVQSLTNKINEQ